MRLAEFITGNIEPILAEWEAFARSIARRPDLDQLALRDHAHELLLALARDMGSTESPSQRVSRSHGDRDEVASAIPMAGASRSHAVDRAGSGFDLPEVVSEYRALRASVIRLWRASNPELHAEDLDDLARFNEGINQSLAVAVRAFTASVEQARQMFLAILGHDLRSPLRTIRLGASLLAGAPGLDDGSARTTSQILASAVAMGRMVRDLVDFSSTAMGAGIPIVRAPMDLAILCQQVAQETRAADPEREVRCTLRGDLTGHWDGDRLRQVLSNLLGNAVQHGEGPVDLTVVGDGDGVLLEVRNGGVPIPPGAMSTVFEPMVRVRGPGSHGTRREGSLGLGLYIARAIVTSHGGGIEIASSRESGTVVRVRLPRGG